MLYAGISQKCNFHSLSKSQIRDVTDILTFFSIEDKRLSYTYELKSCKSQQKFDFYYYITVNFFSGNKKKIFVLTACIKTK